MKKKFAAIMLSTAVTTTLLSGCVTKVENQTTQAISESGMTTGDSEETGNEAVSISFWKWIPTEGKQIDSLMEAWNEENPDINIEVTHVGSSEMHFEKLAAALPSGEGPTVIAMQVGARANQFKEYLEPLDTYAVNEWGENWEDLFMDTALEQCRFSEDENASYYVMPGGMTAVPVIEYNVTAFEALGLTAPETMEELYAVIEASSQNPDIIPGIAIGAKEGWTCRDIWMSIIQQVAPGKLYEAQDGAANFTDAEFIESFEIWKEMWDKGLFAEGSTGMALYPDINENFNLAGSDGNRYYIMQSSGSWHGSGLLDSTQQESIAAGTQSADLVKGVFPLPAVKEDTSPASVASVDICWAINKNATEAEKEAAWKFIAWMSEGEGQKIWANTLQILPCDLDTDLSEAYADITNSYNREALEVIEDVVANAEGSRELKYSEITNAINDSLVAIATGTMSVEEAASYIQTASEAVNRN